MVERGTVRFGADALAGVELPCFRAQGTSDGPRLSLVAGVHGCEYSSIAAVTGFMTSLDANRLSGSITAVPVVSMSSFRARTPFVVPEDGKNLNRCFPGSYDGTFTDALARGIFEELIEPADVLVDLHGGDQVEALAPFTLYDASSVEERSRDLAIAFGLPYVVRSAPSEAPIGGTTSSAAAAAGVPAIIAEVGGRGLLEESAVQTHVAGLENVLRSLEMLPGDAERRDDLRAVGRFVWLRSREEGWWDAAVEAGADVRAGDRLGVVRNLYGDEIEAIAAPDDGVVLFLTTSPAVSADGLLLGLGADVSQLG